MRPFHALLLAMIACDGPADKSTDDTDASLIEESDPSESDPSVDSDPADDTDPAGPDDTETVTELTALFEDDFETPVLSAFASTAPPITYTSRISLAGDGSLVIARNDSNEVSSPSVSPPSGSQFLVLTARDAYVENGTARTRHEAFVDVVASMVDGTTYTLTAQVGIGGGSYDPTVAFLRLINPLQKGAVEDGSWPQFTAGAYAAPDRSIDETFQALTATYTAGPADVGMPLTLSMGIQSADEVFPVSMYIDDLRVVED